jgi:hypothetical protein
VIYFDGPRYHPEIRPQRWKWRRLKCWLGLHSWWLGPTDRDGFLLDEHGRRVHHYRDLEQSRGLIAEWCGGSSPFCRRRRLVPVTIWHSWRFKARRRFRWWRARQLRRLRKAIA